jgi:hypothetical protein
MLDDSTSVQRAKIMKKAAMNAKVASTAGIESRMSINHPVSNVLTEAHNGRLLGERA